MNNNPASSPSLDELGRVPCVLYHRDGGYLCVEPKSKDGGNGAIAFNRSVIPPRKFILQPKQELSSTTLPRSKSRRRIRTKNEFFGVLDQLIDKEISIWDVVSQKYLAAERGVYGKLVSKFEDKAQFFYLGRRDNGAYFFRKGKSEGGLYLRKSSKKKNWVMKGSRGAIVNADTSQVNFSSSFESNGNANDWIIEPDDGVFILDSHSPAEGQNTSPRSSVLFLCVADTTTAARTDGLEASYHFRNVPPAWRSKEQWQDAVRSINAQRLKGNEYCVHTDHKNKWIAKCTSGGKLYIVIASSNFHQELMEDCCDGMEAMRTSRRLAAEDLSELGRRIQMREETLTNEENEKTSADQMSGEPASVYERMEDVRVALLHRSGEWFKLTKEDSGPLSLYLEPVGDDQGHKDTSPPQAITTAGDYFARLNQHSTFAIKNERGHYLFSKKRDVFGKETKLRTKYLIPEFAQLKPPRQTPETFAFEQNANTGGISIMSTSNEGYFLTRNKKGKFVFMPSAKEEDHLWFVDTPDLQSGISSEGILFACIIRQGSRKAVVSGHAAGRPTACRSKESWDYILDLLLEEIKEQSSTVVADTDTGYQWFATNPYGKELFIVVGTEGFPLYYGTKALMAMEDLYYDYGETGLKGESTDCKPTLTAKHLHRVMRGIDTEYRYEVCFGNDEVLDLIQEVEDLTDKMRANVEAIKENIATAQEIEERATELHDLAKQFRKKANKAKYKVAAAAVAGGCVAGGILGWLIGGPAGAFVLETQAAEIALGASIMAFPGVMRGMMLLSTDKFWKRKFVNFGRCIDSRRRGRARGRNVANLEGDRADLNVRYCDSWVLVDSPPERKLV